MDNLTKEQRTKNMRAIRSKDSVTELKLRRALWARGYRYRKNHTAVYGKPDIVFLKQKVAIFCDGDFWHGYNWEERKHAIKSNLKYWHKKIERNMQRDEEVNQELSLQGWTVIRLWEREIKKNLEGCLQVIEKALQVKEFSSNPTGKVSPYQDCKLDDDLQG